MLGIVGFFFLLSLSSGPVCGGLLEHEAWCQEAKSASHTDLIHQGWRVLVEAPLAPPLLNVLAKPPHWKTVNAKTSALAEE